MSFVEVAEGDRGAGEAASRPSWSRQQRDSAVDASDSRQLLGPDTDACAKETPEVLTAAAETGGQALDRRRW